MLDKVDVTEEEKAGLKFDCTESVHNIQAWKAHLLRSSNQDEAKQHIFQKLDESSCLVIMDWAMKFLPVQYREQMSDFFGRKGRGWHISAVITRATVESKHEVECFVHIFNNCTQNSFAVLSIIEDLLHKVKQEYPLVTSAYLRSDNARCYHSGPLLLSLGGVGETTGVTPVRYDFSEAQAGKDICDQKTAAMKAVDTTRERNKESKIPGISVLNNFQYGKHTISALAASSFTVIIGVLMLRKTSWPPSQKCPFTLLEVW
ncbi:uncharacterized protein [Montipora foliosa]|uniref:uncharacterized protein isoform X1 n=1 Tax=Montipora foliosa TaxID=591990 RepID=UPI0035F11EE3